MSFRSKYYGSLGVRECAISPPEDNFAPQILSAFDELLVSPVVDLDKLSALCFSFGIPTVHRPLCWMLLLGVFAPYQELFKFSQEHLQSSFEDILSTTKAIKADSEVWASERSPLSTKDSESDSTPDSEEQASTIAHGARVLSLALAVRIMGLRSGSNAFQAGVIVPPAADDLNALCRFVSFTFLQSSTSFEVSRGFWTLSSFLIQHNDAYPEAGGQYFLCNLMLRLLGSLAPDLTAHMATMDVHVDDISLRWFSSFFAVSFPFPVVQRIWDRMLASSFDFAAYFAVALMLHFRTKLLALTFAPDFSTFLLTQMPTFNVNAVLERACELYVSSKPLTSAQTSYVNAMKELL